MIMLREAGGTITDIDTLGDALVTGNVVCGNEFVHGELVKILRK
jgi:myo-inositol-1(or 4)-monophosphatase